MNLTEKLDEAREYQELIKSRTIAAESTPYTLDKLRHEKKAYEYTKAFKALCEEIKREVIENNEN